MKYVGQLLGHHLKRYPAMQLEDVYKLLHQAALGSGHAVPEEQLARRRLAEEVQALDDGPDEPVADVISPDGRLARIHLRAYRDAGHDFGALADAFILTAGSYRGAREKLVRFCCCIGELADSGALPFPRDKVDAYFESIARAGYPVVRHSQPYRDVYRPAYRVVALEFLPAVEPASPS